MKGSLRSRMTFGFTVTFALFALAAIFAFSLWSRHAAYQDAEERVGAAVEHLLLEWEEKTPTKAIREVHEDARLDAVSMILVDAHGRTLAQDGHPVLAWPVPKAGWIARVGRGTQGTVAAGMPWRPIVDELRSQTLLLATFAMLGTSIVGAVCWTLVGRTLLPIDRLANAADAASSDPLHARLVSASEDAEIVHLVGTLNSLLQRLAEGAKSREGFYASAAHELRTPLAVLSADLEIALSRPRSPEEYAETLQGLQSQTRRLILLTEGLLTLNRLESFDARTEREATNPADVVADALRRLARTIHSKGLHVVAELDDDSIVEAPANHVEIIVRNLVENAVRHSPEGEKIEVVAQGAIRILNRATDDVPEDFEPLFEPFARGDPSRALDGNGLGLAICRRIGNLNGWAVTLRRDADRVIAEVDFSTRNPSENTLR